MRLVNLMPLQEIDFPNQRAFDQYNKIHKLRPDTEVTVAGRKTTAGRAAQNSTPVKGQNVFGGDDLDKKDKEQIKQFKDLGLDRDKAVKAHSDANEYAKKLKTKAEIVTGEHTTNMINLFRKAKVKPDDATLELLVKLQKTNGEAVTDTKKGKISYFLFDGSKYEMTLDGKNKTATTISQDDIHPKLKDLYKQQFGTEPGQSEEEPIDEPFDGGMNVLDRVSDLLPIGSGFTNKSTGDRIMVKGYIDGHMLVSYEKYPNKILKWPLKQFLKMTANKELQFQPKSK